MTDCKKPPGKRGAHRVAVIAHLATIEKMCREGHTLQSIYDEIPGLNSMSYPVFTHHVRKYLTIRKPTIKVIDGPTQIFVDKMIGSANAILEPPEKPVHRLPDRKPVFEHDPDSAKKRDDLI